MENKSKRITGEDMLQMLKRLRAGETVKCILCEKGVMESAIEDFVHSHCFVCNSCGEKLNIN